MAVREPAPSRFAFPDPDKGVGKEGIVCVGGDFQPGTLLAAYRRGMFPWPMSPSLVPWCSPDPRAVFPLEAPDAWSRSLRRARRLRPFRVTVDEAFVRVVESCGKERRDGTWITHGLARGYAELHALGWSHSVEVWNTESNELVGGIYGIAIGAFFAGESMFHRETDASKVAFVSLVELLRAAGYRIFDVQVMSPHLASLGCVTVPRRQFLRELAEAVRTPCELTARSA